MPGVDALASVLNGANAPYMADMYARWINDPASVDSSFGELFGQLNDEARGVLEDASGASWAPRHFEIGVPEPVKAAPKGAVAGGASPEQVRAAALDSLRALMLIRAYRVRGHLEAQLDPLGLQTPASHTELDPATYGFGPGDRNRAIFIDGVLGRESATITEILEIVRASYCGSIGVEFMHIQDPEQKTWIQRRIEGAPWAQGLDALDARFRHRRQDRDPDAADRGRRLRDFLPAPLRRHQALRARRRRGHHPRPARADRDGGRRGGQRDRHRHAASRSPEHAGQHSP